MGGFTGRVVLVLVFMLQITNISDPSIVYNYTAFFDAFGKFPACFIFLTGSG